MELIIKLAAKMMIAASRGDIEKERGKWLL